MTDRHDLDAKLLAASDWVRAEFAAIEDVAAGLGCEQCIESGPGVAYRLDGRLVGSAHPKLKHVMVGLPNAMRPDVGELTGALNNQQDKAWFRHVPGGVDQETVELLLTVSAEDASNTSTAPADQPTTADTGRTAHGDRLDGEADLQLILTLLTAFARHEERTGQRSAVKPLREALFFRWEGPRLPRGGKYSPLLCHSPAARVSRALHGTRGLVFEHVQPVSGVIRGLLAQLPTDTAALREVLDANADRVIVTKDEDRRLTAAGCQTESPDPADPWSRYTVLGWGKDDAVPYAPAPAAGT